MGRDILYLALILDDDSVRKLSYMSDMLVSGVYVGDEVKKYCHHMTIAFRPSVDSPIMEWFRENEGRLYDMRVIGLGISEKAIAVRVETECPSSNKIKHVTLLTNISNGGKPVDSNYITDWKDLSDRNMVISGKVSSVCK